MSVIVLQIYPHFNLLILKLTLNVCLLTALFYIRYHLVGQVYSLEEIKNLRSVNSADDLMLNISVQGPKVTALLSILTFRND